MYLCQSDLVLGVAPLDRFNKLHICVLFGPKQINVEVRGLNITTLGIS